MRAIILLLVVAFGTPSYGQASTELGPNTMSILSSVERPLVTEQEGNHLAVRMLSRVFRAYEFSEM